jgi:predicted dehydrogenase
MTQIYTASVVGGGWGGTLNMTGLGNSGRFELVAAADIKPEVCRALEEQYPGIRTFTDYKELFATCPTDVVCVATYAPTHEAITMDALELPLKGICVEKPLGASVAEGRRILEAVKTRGLPMAVPHPLLAEALPLEIIERVQRGDIGDLRLVEVEQDKWDLLNAGIHWFNFFVHLTAFEDMDWILAALDTSDRTYRDSMQVESSGVTYAQTVSGIRYVMHAGDRVLVTEEQGKQTTTLFRLVGNEGLITFYGVHPEYRILNAENPEGTDVRPEAFRKTEHEIHLNHMAEQIDSGELDYGIPDSSLTALEYCEAAYLSHRHRCKINFTLETFEPPAPGDWDPGAVYGGVGGGLDGRSLL